MVGTRRALTDGEFHGTIYDVAVRRDYQRRRAGSRIMNEILGRLPVWRILLVAEADAQPFSARLGFEQYTDVLARIDRDRLSST